MLQFGPKLIFWVDLFNRLNLFDCKYKAGSTISRF